MHDGNHQWNWVLTLAVLATTLGHATFVGYNSGVLNQPANVIKRFIRGSFQDSFKEVELTYEQLDSLYGFVVAIYHVGGMVGSLLSPTVSNRFGRRGGLLYCSILAAIATACFLGCRYINSLVVLIIGRILVGCTGGLIIGIMPMYLTEIAPMSYRGTVGVCTPVGVAFGMLVSQVISSQEVLGNDQHWQLCIALAIVPLIFGIAIFPFLPESPNYLYILKRDSNRAINDLCRLTSKTEDQLKAEIDSLELTAVDYENQRRRGTSFKAYIMDRTLTVPFLLVAFMQFGQQSSGMNAVFYYSDMILEDAGYTKQVTQLMTIGIGAVNVLVTAVAALLMRKCNRRAVMQLSLGFMALFLFLFPLSIYFKYSSSAMTYVITSIIVGLIIAYGLGLGVVPYFMGSELFDVGPRALAMAIGGLMNWVGSFTTAQFFPIMADILGVHSFYLFILVVLALLIFIRIYLPETRGVEVRQTVQHFRDEYMKKRLKQNKKFDKSWVTGNVAGDVASGVNASDVESHRSESFRSVSLDRTDEPHKEEVSRRISESAVVPPPVDYDETKNPFAEPEYDDSKNPFAEPAIDDPKNPFDESDEDDSKNKTEEPKEDGSQEPPVEDSSEGHEEKEPSKVQEAASAEPSPQPVSENVEDHEYQKELHVRGKKIAALRRIFQKSP